MQHVVGSSSSLAGRLAAQYVRMSTDHQEYSTENQKLAIANFAEKQGITVVATYEDAGKSGVTLKGRPALLDLLQDVQSRANEFSLVLVYDVSRWGRFQDVDECAHYEYLCREAGVQVVYCAEQFAWDGSASAALMKTIKRTMAGEYSRELSQKVFVGQCRLAELGFWQGAAPGYGLQRLLLASDGTVKGRLCDKERKNIQSDRVIVVPGDEREVSLVRRIYDWYVIQGLGCKRIADRLNVFGLCNNHGRPWNPQQITSILSNEKYAGTNVYGRTSKKLGANWHRNLPSEWSRAHGAFPALVDQVTFKAAEAIRINRTQNLSDDEILKRLKDFVRSSEVVSAKAIDDASGMPGGKTYWRRFGCMQFAYARVGFERDYVGAGREVYRASRAALQGCIERTTGALKALGHVIEISRDETTIRVDDELVVRFAICLVVQFDSHRPRWRVRWPTYSSPDLLVVLRQDSAFELPLDFYVFPRGSLPPGYAFSLSVRVGSSCPFETFRYPDESVLLELTERTRIEALNVR
ncbi:Site-specific DNA recombinase [Paraburkholderia fungorum]|uniref:Site-specific DNA recombinase n=1 Tax=Paraburkholderia fungorum TaxID=134537 RepID=A0A1H1JNP9_9BURK|nr:recombinase family protein [Paraburkholderia fungorum]SDR51319.1 Site-specific DNA recombinase [Paraburkholderia fungorum]